MKEWCMNNPFLAFTLVIIAAMVADNVFGNLCRVLIAWRETTTTRIDKSEENKKEAA